MTAEDVTAFRKGLDIGEKNLTKPAELVILKSESDQKLKLLLPKENIIRLSGCLKKQEKRSFI